VTPVDRFSLGNLNGWIFMKQRWRNRALRGCQIAGVPILVPVIRLMGGENVREQLQEIGKFIVVPFLAMLAFIGLWAVAAERVKTDSAQLPSPVATWAATKDLWKSHLEQRRANAVRRQTEWEAAVNYMVQAMLAEQQAEQADDQQRAVLLENAKTLRKQALIAANYVPSSAPTFIDQTFRSIGTVFVGFLIATLVAVPLGILCGMSPIFNAAVSPMIQIFKPVSPLAWLPIATIVIVWWYSDRDPETAWFSRAFLISATTVSLCSLWPTLVNTALGVASVNPDYLNVAKVLRLSWWQTLIKIILPASLPLMFAGLRISLGVGWMVLIAADMLAQNPGLGKFVWDMFQNGSDSTYAKIAVAVLVIGLVGLVLDRLMVCLKNLVSFDAGTAA
jgi:nitrate/nitrite transport system permease protein